MSTGSVDPRTLNWASRNSKRRTDEWIAHLFEPFLEGVGSGEKVTMLSLPANAWGFERYMLDQYDDFKWSFTGIEANEGVYRKMKSKSRTMVSEEGTPVVESVHNCTTRTYLRENSSEVYDIIYFDYMGTWSQSKEEDVVKIAGNHMCKVFACTIALARGRPETLNIIKSLSSFGGHHLGFIEDHTGRHMDNPHYKITGVPERIVQLTEEVGNPFKLVGGFVYDSLPPDMEQTASEMTMVFQVKS